MNSSNPFAMMMNMMNQSIPSMGSAPSMGPMNLMNNGINPTPGATTFSLNKPGFYFVTFNGVGAATGATVGNIVIQLQRNGVNVPGAFTSAASTTALTDVKSLSFSTIIQVKPSCCAVDNNVNLTFVNTGIPTTFSNINVAITKLC